MYVHVMARTKWAQAIDNKPFLAYVQHVTCLLKKGKTPVACRAHPHKNVHLLGHQCPSMQCTAVLPWPCCLGCTACHFWLPHSHPSTPVWAPASGACQQPTPPSWPQAMTLLQVPPCFPPMQASSHLMMYDAYRAGFSFVACHAQDKGPTPGVLA